MAAGQTVVRYGDVWISNCLTREFRQEVIYDDSETDMLYHKFSIRVIGWITGRTSVSSVGMGPTNNSGSAGEQHREVRHQLMEPRRDFEMIVGATDSTGNGGTTLLEARGAKSSDRSDITGLDLNNGPKPRLFSIKKITADHLYEVEFGIEVHVLECDTDGGSSNTSGVLSNRWSVSDEIDSNFYTTRTYSGRLVGAVAARNPNDFRGWVVPPVTPGMQRERMEFKVSADGLKLDYTVVDKEVAWAAPAPATEWQIVHNENLGQNGMTMTGDISVYLGGDRNADRKELFAIAAKIITSKLLGIAAQPGRVGPVPRFIEAMRFTDEWSNRQTNGVRAYAAVRHTPERLDKQNLILNAKLGTPIDQKDLAGYNSNLSRGSRPGETAEVEGPISMVGAFSSYLQSACSETHKFEEAIPSEEGTSENGNGSPSVSARIYKTLPERQRSEFSLGHFQSIYTEWTMQSHYATDQHKIQLPIAKAFSDESSGDSSASASDDTSVNITLAAPTARRTVRLHGERAGLPPELPQIADYTQGNIRATLLRKDIIPQVPSRTADGAQLWVVDVEYEFALSRPPSSSEPLRVGVNPWESIGVIDSPEIMFGEVDA